MQRLPCQHLCYFLSLKPHGVLASDISALLSISAIMTLRPPFTYIPNTTAPKSQCHTGDALAAMLSLYNKLHLDTVSTTSSLTPRAMDISAS